MPVAVSCPAPAVRSISIAKRLTPAGFVPGGVGKALQRPTRLLLPDLVRSLTNKLEEDWDGTDFQLISTCYPIAVGGQA